MGAGADCERGIALERRSCASQAAKAWGAASGARRTARIASFIVAVEVLSGKREINARQARVLAQRFGVSTGLNLTGSRLARSHPRCGWCHPGTHYLTSSRIPSE